jgi:probable phosphoglycerate mutase
MKINNKNTFYFVRHGQTDANAQSLMCGGDWDIPLNEVGQKQSIDLKDKVNSLKPTPTIMCVSPMLRAKQTADNLNSKSNLPIVSLENLREWCVGDWERQHWDNVPNPFKTDKDPKNGETRLEFEQRVINVINDALVKHEKENILFVSHGAFAHTLFTFLGVDKIQIENCVIYKISTTVEGWTLEKA